MREPLRQYGPGVLILLLLLSVAGCAVERGKVYSKDGKQYGVTPGMIWRERWWNYYQRGVSYATGEFWHDAMADFGRAIERRQADQRRARTYGLHFIDYFPHRELGVVYYHLSRYPAAIRELETSLRTVDTAKAKYYLNKARREQLEQTRRDMAPPRIFLTSPTDGLLTNRFTITVRGQAEDDTYVSAVAINGRAQFIELAERRIPFAQQVALHNGSNSIDIVAVDLLGRLARKRLTVQLDHQGPLLSLDRVEVLGKDAQQRARVTGSLFDRNRVKRFQLAGRTVPPRPEHEWEFRQEVPLTAGMGSIPFEIEDVAGNVTRGEIALSPTASGPPGIREGRPAIQLLPRWTFLNPGTVVSDLPAFSPALPRIAQQRDRISPVIRLTDLEARQTVYADTVYLEGKVSDASAITAFSINGESLWRRQSHQLFFSYLAPLQVGDNRFLLDAVDEAGNTARRAIIVTRKVQEVRKLDARLLIALLPFAGTTSALGETAYDHLLTAFVEQRRFHLLERERLQAILGELRLSQTALVDPQTAAQIGKIAAAEGMLVGKVTETPQAFEVFARFVDVETSVVMAAADVYGEDLTLRDVKRLMQGLAWKFHQEFPLVEGVVTKKEGKHVFVDRGSKHALKKYMKMLLFRDREAIKHPSTGQILGTPIEPLGEARVDTVFEELSQATLLRPEQAGKVKQLDKVITK